MIEIHNICICLSDTSFVTMDSVLECPPGPIVIQDFNPKEGAEKVLSRYINLLHLPK